MSEKEKILKQFIVWLYETQGYFFAYQYDRHTVEQESKENAVQVVDEYIEYTRRDIKHEE